MSPWGFIILSLPLNSLKMFVINIKAGLQLSLFIPECDVELPAIPSVIVWPACLCYFLLLREDTPVRAIEERKGLLWLISQWIHSTTSGPRGRELEQLITLHSQSEREEDVGAYFSFCTYIDRGPIRGMVPPSVKTHLSSSVKTIGTTSAVSKATPDSAKLMTRTVTGSDSHLSDSKVQGLSNSTKLNVSLSWAQIFARLFKQRVCGTSILQLSVSGQLHLKDYTE